MNVCSVHRPASGSHSHSVRPVFDGWIREPDVGSVPSSTRIEARPAMTMKIERTAAKIGRSMKKREKLIALNDELRATFRGGQVVLDTGDWELSLQLRARVLLYLSLHTPEFHDDGYHDAFGVCGRAWHLGDFAKETIAAVRERVGEGRVICGLSGGVDSSVTAALLSHGNDGIAGELIADELRPASQAAGVGPGGPRTPRPPSRV